MKRLIILLFFLACLNARATTYYVSTTGSGANPGTFSQPWDVATATAQNATLPEDTVIFLDGLYNNVTFTIHQITNTTFRSLNKWGAVFENSAGNGISIFNSGASTSSGISIIGFKVLNAAGHGIFIQCNSNCVVWDCWLNGVGTAGIHSGISAVDGTVGQEGTLNMLYWDNLIENVGNTANAKFDHCMYVSGTNITISDNVTRYATGNGIQINDNTNLLGSTNINIFNDLSYNNARAQIILSSSFGRVGANIIGCTLFNQTNYVLANSNTNSAIGINVVNGTCTVGISNCVLIGGGGTLYENIGTKVVNNDYNIFMRSDNLPAAAHNIQVANGNGMFVNTNAGLFWPATGSAAIGAAFPSMASAHDFFGVPQASVSDIGAFQYNSTYATDSRTLDPSGSNPNYWAFLTPQTYYVADSSHGGDDGNMGLEKTHPTLHGPNTTIFAGSGYYTHVAGDHFIYKGSDHWVDPDCFIQPLSGGASLAVQDYYGVDQTWFDGGSWTMPSLDGNHTRDGIIYCPPPDSSIIFDSLWGHSVTEGAVNKGVVVINNVTNLTFTNCLWNDWTTTLVTDITHGGFIGIFNSGFGCTNINQINCEIENSANGASGKWSGVCVNNGGVMTGCKIHDNCSGILYAQDVNGCQIYDMSFPYSGFDPTYHCNGFYMANANAGAPGGPALIQLRNSYLANFGDISSEAYPNVPFTSCAIYNNVFSGRTTTQLPIAIDNDNIGAGSGQNCYIFNNTCSNSVNNSAFVRVAVRAGWQMGTLAISNNAVFSSGGELTDADTTGGTVTTLQVGNNYLPTPSQSAPWFTVANLYAPTSPSAPTVGQGGSLNNIFTTDINGVTRGNLWDIGAYQFQNSFLIIQYGAGPIIQFGGNTIIGK